VRLFQLRRWFRRPRADPYRNFAFRVLVDGRPVAGATSSSMTRPTSSTSHHREPITLERAVSHDGEFVAWATETAALEPAARTTTTLGPVRRDLVVERRNEAGQPSMSYVIFGAWVSAWHAEPARGPVAGGVRIEAFTIEHVGWERVSSTNGSQPAQNV
jgi:phage tail-like protein